MSYSISASAGSASVDASGVVTVTVVGPGVTSMGHGHGHPRRVYHHRGGALSASALDTGTTPTFSAPVLTADGFTFDIANYDVNATYTVGATSSGIATIDSFGQVVVTGGGAWRDLDGHGHGDPGRVYHHGGGSVGVGAGLYGDDADLLALTRTWDGFTFDIANYDVNATYTVGATSGGIAMIDSFGQVVVTGVAPGVISMATVTATRGGYTTMAAALSASALDTGTTPTFSALTRTSDGFTFAIANYSPSTTYLVTATGSATAVIDSGAHVYVSGLTSGAASIITVTAIEAGFTATSAHTTGSALATGTTPTLSTPARTAGGYTTAINNYSASVTYTVVATGEATVTVDSSGHISITALEPGAASTATVTATRDGYTTTSAQTTGSALFAGRHPRSRRLCQPPEGSPLTSRTTCRE